MKKYLLLVVSFLMFASISEGQGQSTCTSPWTTMIEIVTVGGCNYEVELCVWCAPAYPGEVKVIKIRNAGPCSSTLDQNQITQGIITQLMNPYSLWFNLCNNNLPPCKNSPPFIVTVDLPICWKVKLVYQDLQDTTNNVYLSFPCDDDAFCRVENKYCKDKYGVKHHTEGNYLGFYFPYECDIEGYNLVMPTVLNGESDCYILHTKCNE